MKAQILKTLAALALITTSAAAQETPMENHTASYIAMPAAEGQTEAFAEFLAGAAPIVADTEPGTVLWFPSRDQRNNGQAVSPLHARPRSNLDAVGNRSAGASNHAYRNSRNSYHRLTPRFVQAPCRANPARPAPASRCRSSYREIRLSSACSENGGPPWPGWRASAACGRWPALPGA